MELWGDSVFQLRLGGDSWERSFVRTVACRKGLSSLLCLESPWRLLPGCYRTMGRGVVRIDPGLRSGVGGPQGKPWKSWYGRESGGGRPGTFVLTAALVSMKPILLLNPTVARSW